MFNSKSEGKILEFKNKRNTCTAWKSGNSNRITRELESPNRKQDETQRLSAYKHSRSRHWITKASTLRKTGFFYTFAACLLYVDLIWRPTFRPNSHLKNDEDKFKNKKINQLYIYKDISFCISNGKIIDE